MKSVNISDPIPAKSWLTSRVKQAEVERYLKNGQDFINDELIKTKLAENKQPEPARVRAIIDKALTIERLEPDETAALLNVTDEALWQEIFEAGLKIKKKVYDNRIVTFAPLYISNLCVNNCLYCGFRNENTREIRRMLSLDEITREAESLVQMGHKRMIMVCGEHPHTDADFIAQAMKAVYEVRVPTRMGYGQIRRVNVNAAPLPIEELKKVQRAGIGTYQVFQETYHHATYQQVHPATIKADYRWRLYALHRAMDAGIDDVAVGALFGLYDYRFEVMGLIYHAIDLEERFNIGPHTVSFPRLNPAEGSDYVQDTVYKVTDEQFKKLVAVIRLSIPYAGLIVTARETAAVRREIISLGCTQTDASTRIGIGAYSEPYTEQQQARQQFMLGDTRSLDELIREFADMGIITSFCTAGYRCGRTGEKIMGLLKSGQEGKFCKLNAILTFREWLDDFASPETKQAGERVIAQELAEIKQDPFFRHKNLIPVLEQFYERIKQGERDLGF
jgi:2-iminoacetate synthase